MGIPDRLDHFLGAAVLRPVGVVFLAGGVLAISLAFREFRVAWEATGWPVVEGEVRSSALVGRATPRVAYGYRVDGGEYTGKVVHVGQYAGVRSYALELVRRYPAGAAVRVSYRPGDPATAVLEHRFPWPMLVLLGCGLLLTIAGWLCVRSRRRFTDMLRSG